MLYTHGYIQGTHIIAHCRQTAAEQVSESLVDTEN